MILDKMENASNLPAIWQTDKEKQLGRDAGQNVAIFSTQLNLKEKKENPLILEKKGETTPEHIRQKVIQWRLMGVPGPGVWRLGFDVYTGTEGVCLRLHIKLELSPIYKAQSPKSLSQ